MIYSWKFALETKDQNINDLMPTFLRQERELFFEVAGSNEPCVLEEAEANTKELIGELVLALEEHLESAGGSVSDLKLCYGCDHSCGHYWSIEGKYGDEPLRVEYTDDWYEEIEVTVGPPKLRDITGWGTEIK